MRLLNKKLMGTLGCINELMRRDKENRELRKLNREKEFIPFKDIYKFEIFKDGFFYGKPLGINIHFRNGSLKKFYIGTLEALCIQKLNNLLNSKL